MLRARTKFQISSGEQYSKHEVLVYKDQRVVVPPAYRQDLIQASHKIAHLGLNTTKRTLEKHFYWPGLYQDVDVALSTCVGCLHRQTTNLKKGEHHSKPIPPNRCHKVYVDVIGPVSVKSRKKYLLLQVLRRDPHGREVSS